MRSNSLSRTPQLGNHTLPRSCASKREKASQQRAKKEGDCAAQRQKPQVTTLVLMTWYLGMFPSLNSLRYHHILPIHFPPATKQFSVDSILAIEWPLRYSSLHYKKGGKNNMSMNYVMPPRCTLISKILKSRQLCNSEPVESSLYLLQVYSSTHLEYLSCFPLFYPFFKTKPQPPLPFPGPAPIEI